MLSPDKHNKILKSDIAVLKIADMCVGGLSAPAGQVSQTHCRQNERGTAHIHVRTKSGPKPFLEI
jgi:hypothetical protein